MAQQIIHERNHCPCGPHVLPGWGSPTPMCARARVRACGRARMRAYMRARGRVCACAHTCACAYPRVYARRRVRMGACAYMRDYGTVRGGGMRLSDVGSCLVIVAWCNCCMCNYMGMVSRPELYGVVVFAWFMVVSTRRGTLVFATTLGVLEYPDLRTINDALYLSYRKAVSQTESLKPHGARHCPART